MGIRNTIGIGRRLLMGTGTNEMRTATSDTNGVSSKVFFLWRRVRKEEVNFLFF